MQQDKNGIFKSVFSAKFQTYRLVRRFKCVVFTQISLRKINSFAFQFLFQNLIFRFGQRLSIRADSTLFLH